VVELCCLSLPVIVSHTPDSAANMHLVRPRLSKHKLLTHVHCLEHNFVSLLHRSIFRDRLQPAAESQEQEGGEAGQPSLSLFGLMKEGHLSRSAAAMLFYQVCGKLQDCTACSTRDAAVLAIHWVCDRQCSRCCSCGINACGSSISRAFQTVCCCCTLTQCNASLSAPAWLLLLLLLLLQ
jgi:hypothetical protein